MILVMENPSAPRSLTKSLTLSKDPDLPILFTKRSIQEFGTVPLTYGEKFGDELKYGFCKKLLLPECNSDQLNIS